MRPKPRIAERLLVQLDARELRALPLAGGQRHVRLRDVAREREQQRHRVLGRGHDVRLGRVGDDDPALGRGLDVDVVDAHAGAADHAQALRAARSARRSSSSPSGSGCRRSRRCARRAPRRSSRRPISTSKCSRSSATPESPIFSLTSTFGRSPVVGGAGRGLRRGRAHHASLSTTQSMHAVSACTSAGSTAGNIPTRSWLRPSLR